MRLPLIFLVITTGWAQTVESPCRPNRQIQAALESWNDPARDHLPYSERRAHREQLLQPLLERSAADLTVQQRYVDLHRGLWSTGGISTLLEKFQRRMKAEPDQLAWRAMYAKLLIGRRTAEALGILEDLALKDPRMPLVRVWLADVYAFYPNHKDHDKAWRHLQAYRAACPESMAGFSVIGRLHLQAAQEQSAVELRRLLERSQDPADLRSWPTLWSLEFKARPATGHEALRKQVRADLNRIQSRDLTEDPRWYEAQQSGYEILADKAAARKIAERFFEKFPNSNEAIRSARAVWRESNPYPKMDAPLEERASHARALLAATDEWLRRWPHSPIIWDSRLDALHGSPDPQRDELGVTADRLLETLRLNPDSFRSYPPISYRIGEAFLKHDYRLDRVPALFEMGTGELEESRARDLLSDFEPESESHKLGNYQLVYSRGFPLLIGAYLKAGNTAEARKALTAMEEWWQRHTPKPDDPEAGKDHARREALLWQERGRLAEAENRKADAIAAYAAAVGAHADPMRDSDLAIRLQELWRELGGTPEGLQALTELSRRSPTENDSEWRKMRLTLPEFEIADTSGRVWRLADLKGKRTLVNVWATWCGPCKWEMPVIQRLYERLKDREGFQVISMNVDENPGLIQPFVRENGYTFPALPAKAVVDRLVPFLAIPRTWLVNASGVITHERVGFGYTKLAEEKLAADVIQAMEAMK